MRGIDFNLSQLLADDSERGRESDNHDHNSSAMLEMIPEESYDIKCLDGDVSYDHHRKLYAVGN